MSKAEMLIEFTVQDLVEYIVRDKEIEYDKAMKFVYSSVTFDKLSDPETGLYLESSSYVYGLLRDEMKFGIFAQNEI